MPNPLNPTLYALLKQKFGEVKFANEGCPAYFNRMPDPMRPGRTIIHAAQWGEYYCVRCPFCNDHSPRMWINHLYASEVIKGRRQYTNIVICYNEQCMRHPGRVEQLEHIIFGHGQHLKPRPCTLVPVLEPLQQRAIEPPGEIVPLTSLPEDHAALEYIRSRDFSATTLTEIFNVGLCSTVYEPRFAAARGRLYIPVTRNGELVGWQARAVNPQSEPKYLNAPGMRKSTMLYNYDRAQGQPYVVIVEGVPSVWRLGSQAVALFGKTMSMAQQDLIARTWAKKRVILLLDHDAHDETERAHSLLAGKGMDVVSVYLPDSRDPADYSVDDLSRLLADRTGITPTFS